MCVVSAGCYAFQGELKDMPVTSINHSKYLFLIFKIFKINDLNTKHEVKLKYLLVKFY